MRGGRGRVKWERTEQVKRVGTFCFSRVCVSVKGPLAETQVTWGSQRVVSEGSHFLTAARAQAGSGAAMMSRGAARAPYALRPWERVLAADQRGGWGRGSGVGLGITGETWNLPPSELWKRWRCEQGGGVKAQVLEGPLLEPLPRWLSGKKKKKNLPANTGGLQSTLGWEDSPGEGNGNPLQYCCLENPMDGGAWWVTVYGATEVRHGWATGRHTHTHTLTCHPPLQGLNRALLQLLTAGRHTHTDTRACTHTLAICLDITHTRTLLPSASTRNESCAAAAADSWTSHTHTHARVHAHTRHLPGHHTHTHTLAICLDITHTRTLLPSASTRNESWAAAAAELRHLEGVEGGEQKWGALCSGKLAKQVRYFQELILGAQFVHLISGKALNSITVMSNSTWLYNLYETSRNFLQKIYAWFHILPLHQNQIRWPSPCLLGAVSQSYLKCCLPGYSPHFVPS